MKVAAAHLLALGLLCGCGRACRGESTPGAHSQATVAEAAAPTVTQSAVIASASVDAGPPPLVRFRMISDKWVDADEDAGRYLPFATTTLRVEIAGWSSADITIPCVHPTPSVDGSHVKPKLVGLVSCYVSAQTAYLGVVEISQGEYAVTTWSEDEPTAMDPSPIATLLQMRIEAKLKKNDKWTGGVVMIDLTGHEVFPPPL